MASRSTSSRTERSGEILRDYVKRTDVSVEARGEAIFWLGQARSAENSAFIREVFPTLDTDELRDKAIFSLSQQRTPENARFLLGLAKDRRYNTDLRKSALFWASQQGQADPCVKIASVQAPSRLPHAHTPPTSQATCT